MNNVSIQLGSVELRDFEIPPYIIYGGDYRLGFHRLASGRKAFERLGPDETDIRFAGTFSGPDAAYRARAIDNMRLAGKPVWLTWSSLRYRVVVRSFLLRYKNQQWVEYQARCVVLDDKGPTPVETMSKSAQTLLDLASAAAALPQYSAELTPLGSALAANDAFTLGSANALTAAHAAMLIESTLNTYITTCSGTLLSVNLAGGPGSEGDRLVSAFSAAGQLAETIVGRNYIRRILCTLTNNGK